MIKCQNCQKEMMVGALFCSECGTQIAYEDGMPTFVINHHVIPNQDSSGEKSAYQYKIRHTPEPPPISVGSVLLNIVSSGKTVELTELQEFTIGRISQGQSIVPDIDLSPYQAYEAGVSRMHATIRIEQDQVLVTDLGSINGTKLNGKVISSQIPHPLNHGDFLFFGNLKIQVLFSSKGSGG